MQGSDSFGSTCRTILIIALKNPGVYSAQSVAIHIYGYALIELSPRQDGVRLDFFFLHLFIV